MGDTTIYGQPEGWSETDEGHQTIYYMKAGDVPVSVAARVIYELRLDVERLNNEAIEYHKQLQGGGNEREAMVKAIEDTLGVPFVFMDEQGNTYDPTVPVEEPTVMSRSLFGDVDYGPKAGIRVIVAPIAGKTAAEVAQMVWDDYNYNTEDDWQQYEFIEIEEPAQIIVVLYTTWGDGHRSVVP